MIQTPTAPVTLAAARPEINCTIADGPAGNAGADFHHFANPFMAQHGFELIDIIQTLVVHKHQVRTYLRETIVKKMHPLLRKYKYSAISQYQF